FRLLAVTVREVREVLRLLLELRPAEHARALRADRAAARSSSTPDAALTNAHLTLAFLISTIVPAADDADEFRIGLARVNRGTNEAHKRTFAHVDLHVRSTRCRPRSAGRA